MRALVTNDDGIHAPGLKVLRDAMAALGRVDVVAPLAEQSAVGHAITILEPLRTKCVYRDGEVFGGAGPLGVPSLRAISRGASWPSTQRTACE